MASISRHSGLIAILLTIPAVGGCDLGSSDYIETVPAPTARTIGSPTWTSYRGDAALTGLAAGTLTDSLESLWTYDAGSAIVSSPVVAHDRIYVGCDDGDILCLDQATGKRLWSHATDYLIEAPPLVHGGTVFVGSHDFFMYALDAITGEVRWRHETDEKIVGGATIVTAEDGITDLVVFGSHDARVYALNAVTGEVAWTFETMDRVNGTLAVVDNRVIFGGCDTIVYVLDGATGKEAASVELGGECHIAATVATADNVVYFGHHANEFVAVDLQDCTVKWRYPHSRFGFFAAPAIGSDRVVFGGRDKRLHCADLETGEPLWTFPTRRKIDGGAVICGDRVVVGSGDGRLYMINLTDGSEVWSYDIGDSVFSSPAVVDGHVYVGANDGRLHAFGPGAASAMQKGE